MKISRQSIIVVAVLVTLGAAAVALARVGERLARVDLGAHAPDARAYDLGSGDTVSLRKRYQGQVTLINIWATWCVPCRVEMPSMQLLYDSLASRGFRIAAVSIDAGPTEDVRAFGKELHLSFDLLQDQSGRIQQIYQTTGVPESFLLDKDGVIVKRVIGAHDWNSPVNRALVERLLAEPHS